MSLKNINNLDIYHLNLSKEFVEALENTSQKTGGLVVNFKNNEANFTLNKDKHFKFDIVSDNLSYCFLEKVLNKSSFLVNNTNTIKYFLKPKAVNENSEFQVRNSIDISKNIQAESNLNQNRIKHKAQAKIDITEDFVTNYETAQPRKTLNMLFEEYDSLHGIYKERYQELLQLQHTNSEYDKKFNTAWRNKNESEIKRIGDKYVRFVNMVVDSERINQVYTEFEFLQNKLKFILCKQEELKNPPKTASVESVNKKKKSNIQHKYRRQNSAEKKKKT